MKTTNGNMTTRFNRRTVKLSEAVAKMYDRIKIRTLITTPNATKHPTNNACPSLNVLVSAIINLGRNLHHYVIVEGGETETQLNLLRQNQCSAAQGFYFNRPMHAEDFAAFLAKTKSFFK
ncbi:EAL domain-containing protein (putative c-di-GMP-specific phosphodiesterase class I) [Oxalobacteraceae bacterium GrIS 1.18]